MPKEEGWIMFDHRASPGLPETVARQRGLPPKDLGEGKIFEASVLHCPHCGTTQIKNPLRTRERGFCNKCFHYICDLCQAQTLQPDYVHKTFKQKADEIINATEKGLLGSPTKLIMP